MWYRALHWGTYLHLFSSSNVLKVVLRCSNEFWGVRQGRFYLFTCLWEVVSVRLPWYHDPSGRATDHGPRTRLLILVDYSAGVFTCVSGTRRTWRLCTLSIPPTSSESSGTFSNLWSGTDVPEHTWGLAGSSLAALGHAAADSSSSSSLLLCLQSQVWEEADVCELLGWASGTPELRAALHPSRSAQVGAPRLGRPTARTPNGSSPCLSSLHRHDEELRATQKGGPPPSVKTPPPRPPLPTQQFGVSLQ